jgi:hypothetical protein
MARTPHVSAAGIRRETRKARKKVIALRKRAPAAQKKRFDAAIKKLDRCDGITGTVWIL